MPYKGSKNAIAKHVIDMLPPAEHFYDLFGGGGAISHCALESGKYKFVHYNELNPVVFEGFVKACMGKFRDEKRWISREEFQSLKGSDPYVAICFSFGNNLRDYCYAKEIEQIKKGFHYSIFFNDNYILKQFCPEFEYHYKSELIPERRSELFSFIKKRKFDFSYDGTILEHAERLERLQSLESLGVLQTAERLERLQYSCLSYDKVEIESDSVIYCDPPYIDTNKYSFDFDHEQFYKWARNQKNIYISEYWMPADFKEIGFVKKQVLMDSKAKAKKEKLFTNVDQETEFMLC